MAKQEYIDKNRQWLKDKTQEPDVLPLDKGIFYKVLKKGQGAYRKFNQPGIPGGSTLIFDIQLNGIG